MQLTTEQLKGGWLHPHRVVRNVVASHFTDTYTTDPDVTSHAIRCAREFGWQRFLTWGHQFAKLPLADDAAVEWICGEVERTDDRAPSENLKGHLATMLVKAEIGLLERHHARLLAVPALRPRERQTLLTRLDLAQCPPAEAWRRLEDHCRMAVAGKTFADAQIPEAEMLLEPLERAGSESVARVMEVLHNPPPAGSGDDPADWLTGLMITLAGRLRVEEAAPLIWNLLAVDWDWYYDEVLAALTRIGTPGVVRLVRDRYPQADWNTRLSAASVLSRVRCDESAAVIEEALDGEDDDDLRVYLGTAAAAQLDDRLVPPALAVFNEAPDDPERGEICELLVAFSHLSGYDLPEREEWEQTIDEYDDRMSRLGGPAEFPLAGLLHGLAEDDGDDFDDDVDFGPWYVEDKDAAASPVQHESRVGRNALCPCGSGKKYKRCCLPGAGGA